MNILNRENFVSIAILITVYLFLLVRLILFVYHNSVNVLFWDQWDFLSPLFNENKNYWEIYIHQHGPHRQGLGGILLAIIYPITDWNVIFDAYFLVGLTAISCYLAILIKIRLWGKLNWKDIIIPLSYFTLLQYESYIGTPNFAHGPLPLFLVTLSAYIFTLEKQLFKVFCLTILVFLTTYTSFAIFSGFSVIFILLIFIFDQKTIKNRFLVSIALIFSLLFFASFFIDYRHAPAVNCFKFPHDNPIEYLKFSVLQFSRIFGVSYPSDVKYVLLLQKTFATIIFLTLILVSSWSVFQLLKSKNRNNTVIFYLSSFTILFIVFSAIGRVCLGVNAAVASRYIPYSIPGVIALYFAYLEFCSFVKGKKILKYSIIIGLISLLVVKEFLSIKDQNNINWYRNGKKEWLECYLENYNVDLCNKTVNFKVYPENSRIQLKLDYLEENNLSFFRNKK